MVYLKVSKFPNEGYRSPSGVSYCYIESCKDISYHFNSRDWITQTNRKKITVGTDKIRFEINSLGKTCSLELDILQKYNSLEELNNAVESELAMQELVS